MNYIAYDVNAQMIKRFNTQEEGIAWIQKRDVGFLNCGFKEAPFCRLCYNGRESVEVYRNRKEAA